VEAAKNKQYLQYRTIALRSSILVLQLFSMFYNVLLEFIIVQQQSKKFKNQKYKKWGAVRE
jgi:hypothetical protein